MAAIGFAAPLPGCRRACKIVMPRSRFAGQTSVAIGLLPAIVRADFVARHTVAAPARRAEKSTADGKHKGPGNVRDARFRPSEPVIRRRQYVCAVAAVRSHLRHHVFSDPAAAAKAREGTPGTGQELAPRRHRHYLRWARR